MNTEKITCVNCGQIIGEGETMHTLSNGDIICNDCYESDYVICDDCGDLVHIEETTYINNQVICNYCRNENYVSCACCEELIHRYNTRLTVDGSVCEYCYCDHYVTCANCGDVIHIDDSHFCDRNEEYYCNECYDEDSDYIENYSYKPDPVFYGDKPLYMGIELEIDDGGETGANARKLMEIDGQGRIYCKHDGSIDNGFEIVSHPMTLEYHIKNMCWEDILQNALSMRYTSHNAGTCGLHIHISKNALGNTVEEIDETVAKILYFVEKFWDKMLNFSRRTESQLNQWASRYGIEDKETPDELLQKAKSNYGRYKAINLLPYHTIEFRLFRGTLKYNTFVATLQLVNKICEYCMKISSEDLTKTKWEDFSQNITETELKTYLTERGI